MHQMQQYLSILTAREEMIFLIRIIGVQLHYENRQMLGTVREIAEEVMKGEYKREQLEAQLFSHLNESFKKIFVQKLISKSQKISAFYLNKTQTYFPRLGQLLCQEQLQNISLRASLSGFMNESLYVILKWVSNQQRQKLKHELSKITTLDKDERCNRNEKLFTDPLVQGVRGVKYLNEMHNKFFYQSYQRQFKNVYDCLNIDECSRTLYISGSGFRSMLSSIIKGKNQKEDSVYVAVESTQEIITQRYEKLMKEILDNNYHIGKSIRRYNENYDKFRKRKMQRKPSGNTIGSPLNKRNIKISIAKPLITQSQQLNSTKNGSESDAKRYSIPIQQMNVITESISKTVRHMRLRIPLKHRTKPEEHTMKEYPLLSPTNYNVNLTDSVPLTAVSTQTNLQRIQSVKHYDFQMIKPKLLIPYDQHFRLSSQRRNRNYNYDIN